VGESKTDPYIKFGQTDSSVKDIQFGETVDPFKYGGFADGSAAAGAFEAQFGIGDTHAKAVLSTLTNDDARRFLFGMKEFLLDVSKGEGNESVEERLKIQAGLVGRAINSANCKKDFDDARSALRLVGRQRDANKLYGKVSSLLFPLNETTA